MGSTLFSLVYSVAAREIRGELAKHGLDPHCGFRHESGASGLTCDLLEPMRALFCDHLALRIARRDPEICLRATAVSSGGVILGRDGCDHVCRCVRSALDIRRARQLFTPREQIRRLISAVTDALNRDAASLDLQSFCPER